MDNLFEYVPHPRIAERHGPPKTIDAIKTETRTQRFNAWLAVKITSGVGTMWCAYGFFALALVSLPAILRQAGWVSKDFFPNFMIAPGLILVVAWVAQTFLQLVLLSIIIVGQNIQSAASDKRAEATYKDAEAVLAEAQQIQAHLEAQDHLIASIVARLEGATGPATAGA